MDNQTTQFQGGPPAGFQGGAPPNGFRGGPRAGGAFMRFFLINPWLTLGVVIALLGLMAVAFYLIFKKAGYNGLLGLLMAIPVVNVGLMLWFAFTEWPLLKQLREARAIANVVGVPTDQPVAVDPMASLAE